MLGIPGFTAPATPLHGMTWWLWLAVSAIPDLVLIAGLITLWHFLVRSRRQARRDLDQARAQIVRGSEALWLATELADVGAWSWDLVSGTLTWSDRCKQHFGLRASETVSIDTFYAALNPEDRDRVRAAIDRSRDERTDFRVTYRVMLPDGKQRELAAMGRFTYDTNGKPLSMGGVTLDVTRIMRLETDLRMAEAVSEQQAAELELARRFQVVAENASDVVMETDNDGIVRWVTPSAGQRIGRQPEEIVGTSYARNVHPDDRDKVRSLEQQVRHGMAGDAEVRLRLADGSYRWFSMSLRPIFDDRRAVVRRVGSWHDIHGEVQAREAVATERQRLRAQMASMINPLVLGEPLRDGAGHVTDFTVADANPPACVFFGLERERLQGRHLLDLMPQLATTGLVARFADTADTGRRTVIDDFPLPMPDGSIRWLDMRAARADSWVSLVWRDNTEKQAALEKITASEERFRLLAENSLDVILRLDANDRIMWVSPSVTSVLGWNVADCIGHGGIEFLAAEEARQQYRRDKARVFAGEGAVSRYQVRSANGEIHWMETHASPFRTADGRIDGIVATMRLIDTEVRAEQALERRARTDDLTQLLNRREAMDRLGGLLESGARDVAVLWCDIDRFKEINDVHGHAAGDAVLQMLGERIRGCLPKPDDLGARIGGDELMVVLRGVQALGEVVQMAERLRCSAAEPIPFAADTIGITLSIGATLARADESLDTLLARADDAMYQAKEQGRNRVVAVPETGAPATLAAVG